jgi:hypothetical protein
MNIRPRYLAAILLAIIQIAPATSSAKPASSEPIFNVRQFGAKGDGITKDTAAFQRALDECASSGGMVVVPKGNFLVGSLLLHSRTTLVLRRPATIIGSPDPDDYPLITVRYEGAMVPGHRALLYAENASDVAILGPGTIQGDNKVGNLRSPRGPVMVELVNCRNVMLDGFTDRYRRLWSVHLLFCQNVVARNLTIQTSMSNGDGIDVDSTNHISIDNCDIDTGDDCISLKSGRGASAVQLARPTEDVLIRNCRFASDFAGIGIGSEMSGGIRNVEIENCDFTDGANAIYIKGRYGRAGFFENIHGENFNASTRTFLGINLRDSGIIGIDPVPGKQGVPHARNISFSDVSVDVETLVDGARVLPGKWLEGLSLSHFTGTCQRGITLANASDVSLTDIEVEGFQQPFLTTLNVTGKGLEGAMPLKVAPMDDPQQLQALFSQPPDDSRPMVRWWWFGPAVTKPGLQQQIETMKANGFGGFEVQPTYPVALDNEIPGLVNIKFLSPEFLDDLGFVAQKAKDLGMRMDLTLGSGWPYGGATIDVDSGAGRLRTQKISVSAGQKDLKPELRTGDEIMAAFGDDGKEIPLEDGGASIPATQPSPASVTFFVASHTGMKVKRPAFGAEGFVVDHQSAAAVKKFLDTIADPEVTACGDNVPYALFCDSLESYGEDWTKDFLQEFETRRGYDLRPLLPALVGDDGPKTLEIRHDWGKTLTELFNDYFVKQLRAFADRHHTRLRIQAYGTPSAGLYSYLGANFPEGEDYHWHDYAAARYATSACHLIGVQVCSSETFTWIHSLVFRATPLDIKANADQHFLQGDNLIICHGWPDTPAGVPFPGWSFYVGGVFDDENPWNIVMPDVTRYLQRVSYMLRQGTPVNDVALYLPNDDAWAKFTPGKVALTDMLRDCVGHETVGQILDAGFNLDFFDDEILDARGRVENTGALFFGQAAQGRGERSQGVRYRIVVLPGVERMPVSTARKLEDFANRGGLIIATRRLPDMAPGYLATDSESDEVKQIFARLFDGPGAPGIFIADESKFGTVVAAQKRVRPDVQFSPPSPQIGFVHRATEVGSEYFLANTGNTPRSVTVSLRSDAMSVDQMDPVSGTITPLQITGHPEGYTTVHLDLAAYGSTILLMGNRLEFPQPTRRPSAPATVELDSGWTIAFGQHGKPTPISRLESWTDDPATKSFSGVATYSNHFPMTADAIAAGRIVLDFGETSPSAMPSGRTQGFEADVDAPVRDAAVVYINGKRAGSVWCPPYRADITDFLKPGDNQIEIKVGNTAVNYLAANGFPNYDYRGVTEKYGQRFQPALAAQFHPLPSGLCGGVRLLTLVP